MGEDARHRSFGRLARGAVAALAVLAVAASVVHLVASARATARGAWVDGDTAVLDAVAVSPHDPRVRAAVWHSCPDAAPVGCRFLVAVTRDGFATRELVPLRHTGFRAGSGTDAPHLTATVAGTFLVETADEPAFLLRSDGTRTAVGRPADERPARPGEVVARVDEQAVAIDPRTGAAHALPGGPDAGDPVQQADGRLLRVHIADPPRARFTYQWSDDGGLTWRGHPALTVADVGFLPVPSTRRDTVAFLQGSRAPGRMPLVTAVRGTADGSGWRATAPAGPRMLVDAAVVLPDGRLVVDVVGGSRRATGPWASADWSHFTRLLPPGPAPRDLRLVGSDVRDGHATLLVAAGARAWAVVGGAWQHLPAR